MPSDEDLFFQVQQGDVDALGILARRHQGRLYRLACRLVKDRQAAEDLVQETFLRLLRAARRYRYPEPFLPWLYTIITNLSRDFLKRAYRQREVPTETGGVPVAAEAEAGPGEVVERRAEYHRLVQALLRLSPKHREVLTLHFYEQLTLREIARVCGIPLGTVKSRLSWALRRLRGLLLLPERQGTGP